MKYFTFIAIIVGLYKFRYQINRYPFDVTFKARRIIKAPPNVIWGHIRPRARRKNYNILISSIKSLGDDTYRFYEKDSLSELNYYDLKVRNEKENHFIEFDIIKEEKSPDAVKTAEGQLMIIKDMNNGYCEIRTLEAHKRPSFFTLYVYIFMGAHKDVLRQLACACEGKENISWASAELARVSLREKHDATMLNCIKSIEELLIIICTVFITMLVIFGLWVCF